MIQNTITPVDKEAVIDINHAISEAKRLFHIVFNPEKAIQLLSETIEKYKDKKLLPLTDAYSYKAFIHNYLGDWDEALVVASLGIELDPTHCDSYMARGYAFMKKGEKSKDKENFKNAFNDFTMAQQLAPNYRKSSKIQKYLNQLSSLD